MATMVCLHPTGLQARTYQCFFGLIATSGLRFSEAADLRRADINLADGALIIRETKFGKSRVIPLHIRPRGCFGATPRIGIVAQHDWPAPSSSPATAALSSTTPTPTRRSSTGPDLAGLRRPGVRSGPRIHDLRHTFAVRTLTSWYATGEDVERRLPELTTYLGHTHSEDTYWYLSTCTELLDHARVRLEARRGTAA